MAANPASPYKKKRAADEELRSIDAQMPILTAAIPLANFRGRLAMLDETALRDQDSLREVRETYLQVRHAAIMHFGDKQVLGFKDAKPVPVQDLVATCAMVLIGLDLGSDQVRTCFPSHVTHVHPLVLHDLELVDREKFSRCMLFLSKIMIKHRTVKVTPASDFLCDVMTQVRLMPSKAHADMLLLRRKRAKQAKDAAVAEMAEAALHQLSDHDRQRSDHDAQFHGIDAGFRGLLDLLVYQQVVTPEQAHAVLATMNQVVNQKKAARFLLVNSVCSTTDGSASDV